MNNTDELLKILDRISDATILVIGDVMLDRYWWGSASRLSPEAPVPVVSLQKVSNIPGGAANVAANITSLGASVVLVGVSGTDDSANFLRESLLENNVPVDQIVSSASRRTTTKTRVLVHNQQIARIDEETDLPLTPDEESEILGRVRGAIAGVDAVVLSDYSKGCLTRTLVAAVIADAKKVGRIVVVDPKSRDLEKYNGATLLKPNLAEALNAAGIEKGGEEMADEAARTILRTTSVESLLITLGEHGMKLFRTGEEPVHFPSMARQVFDVTGAGDTVVAALAAAIGAKADLHSAISLANIAAGIAVEKVGTTIVGIDELRHAVGDMRP